MISEFEKNMVNSEHSCNEWIIPGVPISCLYLEFWERPMIRFVMTIQIVSFLEISWRLLIRCYRKILVEFPTYPDHPLNEYLCLKTELQRSLLTSPKSRVAWEITGYDWPLYHITSGNIFTMRGHKCYGTPIDLNSTGPQSRTSGSSWLVSCLMYESEGLGWLSERLGNPDRMFPLQTAGL